MILIMKELNFLFLKKIIAKLKDKLIFAIMAYPSYVSGQKFHNSMDLLLISNKNKSRYVHIKDFNRFMCNKTKNENKKYFCKCCLQCFSSEKIFIEHKENCLAINGKQSVKLKIGSISFKSYFKKLPVPFKIYADFECVLKVVIKIMFHTQKNVKIMFLAVLITKLFVLIINLVKNLFFTEEKMLFIGSLKQFLKSITIVKK